MNSNRDIDSNRLNVNGNNWNDNNGYAFGMALVLGLMMKSYNNLYKEIIEIYNEENPDAQINNLAESFSLIGGYRNYNSYATHVSLGGGNTAPKQIQSIRLTEYS